MLPAFGVLKETLKSVIYNKEEQGYKTDELYDELKALPDSFDAIYDFALKLSRLEIRGDWPYVEPSKFDDILKECATDRPLGLIKEIPLEESSRRVETAFLSSVCACILGKPFEEFPLPTLYEIKEALIKTNEWPLKDYVTEETLSALGRRNSSWIETTRGRIAHVASDDDITYSICGMLLLEKYGINFTKDNIRQLWIENLPIYTVWGPERNILLKAGIASLVPDEPIDYDEWTNILNPGEELCGALIRADAYGYACPGRPDLASKLAWQDASFTHKKTGIYGAMFIAAVISIAQVIDDRMGIFEMALKFIPQRSRFHEIVQDSLDEVRQAKDFEDGYSRIHEKYKEYGACRVYQETGTLINTLKFAENIPDGFCKQVMQGNDTDSFGATSGSILGAYFGPDYFDEKWLKPFNDDIYTTMSSFKERKLSNVAKRMSKLPYIVSEELEKK